MVHKGKSRFGGKSSGGYSYSYSSSRREEEESYEPHWMFLLDADNKVSRMNDQLAHVVSVNAKTKGAVKLAGAKLGSVQLDGLRRMTIEDVANAVADVVGKESVTSQFFTNGIKLVREGSKIDTGVDQLCMTIENDIWIDVLLCVEGANLPNRIVNKFGNLFFFVRTKVNGFDIGGKACTEWNEFLEAVKDQYDELMEDQDEDE